jgi:hypothetical protein
LKNELLLPSETMMLLHCTLFLLAALTFASLSTAAPTGMARFHRPSRQLAENNTLTPLEFCETALTCDECVEYIAKYQADCSCTEMSDGSVKEVCVEECQQCVNGTDVCYFFNFTDTVLQTDDGPEWAGYHQQCVIIENDEFCVYTVDQSVPSPAPCIASVNGIECKSCLDVFNYNVTDFEMDCTNIEPGAIMNRTDTGGLAGFVGIFEDVQYAMADYELQVYPKCPGDPGFPEDRDASPHSVLWITAAMGLVATALLV